MKKKWKNLIILCLAVTLICFLPVRIAKAVENNGSLPSEVSAEENSNLMLEAVPEENCNLPLGAAVEDSSNPPLEGDDGIMLLNLDNEAGGGEENNNGENSGEENNGNENNDSGEALEFANIRKDITYLSDISFQVKGSPTKVTIKKDGQDTEETIQKESDGTYKITVNGREGTYIITALREADGEEKEKISCKVKINGKKDGDKIVLSSGTYALTTGQAYKLEAGIGTYWKVNGEKNNTVYCGGRSFYVSEGKDYHITQAGWGVW